MMRRLKTVKHSNAVMCKRKLMNSLEKVVIDKSYVVRFSLAVVCLIAYPPCPPINNI